RPTRPARPTRPSLHRCNAPVTARQGRTPSKSVDSISESNERTADSMNGHFDISRRLARTAAAIAAAVVLVGGAAWHSAAADQSTTARAAQTVTTPIAHAIAGGRDSYADVVSIAAPAVVTIRTSGKARVSPTQFDGQDPEDLLRRFFGDQFGGRSPRMQRSPRQRALGSGV